MMRRNFLAVIFIATLFFFGQQAHTKEVPISYAKSVGENFIRLKFGNDFTFDSLKLADGIKLNDGPDSFSSLTKNIFIFSISPSPGFIIISADDRAQPILAYSINSEIDANNMAPDLKDWLISYSNQIEDIVTLDIEPEERINDRWISLTNGIPDRTLKSTVTVNPLIETSWNQGTYYNEYCPFDEAANKLTYTGCVATAMAQLMKFWDYPAQGQGSNSYTHSVYGELSANFGATTYNWSAMPSSLNSSNHDVATLMYHCGVSVNMNYGPDGSGAGNSIVLSSLISYFKYSSDITMDSRAGYTSEQWSDLILQELTSRRPVYYTGRNAESGHAFVCDGYDGSYFHFSWGWGGYADGWFSIDNLNPASRIYNDDQKIIHHIFPDSYVEEPILSVQPSFRNIESTGGEVNFSVSNTGTGTMNWSASITEGGAWAHIQSGASGANSGVITLTIDANESNNTRTASLLITSNGASGSPKELTVIQEKVALKPDIYISSLSVTPTSVKPLGTMEGHFEYGNLGEAAMPASHFRYVISKNGTYSADDYLVKYGEMESLTPAYKNTNGSTGSFDLPQSIVTGTWYLIVVLECDSETEEVNEANNVAVVQFTVTEPDKPDIYIKNLELDPSIVKLGGVAEGVFEFGNQGKAEMPASDYQYVISDDAHISADDYLLEEGEFEVMEPGFENPNVTTGEFDLPASVVSGTWYLIIVLDSGNSIDEENEDNNISIVQFTVSDPEMPDIYVKNLIVEPVAVMPLGVIKGIFEFGNLGKADMPGSQCRYLISDDANVSGDDYTLYYGDLAGIDAGFENPNGSTGDFELPESIGIGNWYLIVILDCENEIDEENEGNNKAVKKFAVAQADFYINFKTVYTTSIMPGELFRADIEQGNQGGLGAVPGSYKYFLSKDENISSDDFVWMEGSILNNWPSGYYLQSEINGLRIPQNMDEGDWYVIASLDTNNDILEEKEDNNTASTLINIQANDPVLEINTDSIKIGFEGGVSSFQINNIGTGNLEWLISITQDDNWIEIQNGVSQGVNDKIIYIDFDENQGCGPRTAKIIVETTGTDIHSKEIFIEQISDPANKPDLVVKSLTADFDESLEEAYIHLSINNQGRCVSNDTEIEYYLCEGETIESRIATLGSSTCISLAGDESCNIESIVHLEGIVTGTYYITACVDPSDQVSEFNEENNLSFTMINVSSTGRNDISLGPVLSIFPNPTYDRANIVIDGPGQVNGILAFYDQLGRKVDEIQINQSLPWQGLIDTRRWNSGMYFIILSTDEQVFHQKLIVN